MGLNTRFRLLPGNRQMGTDLSMNIGKSGENKMTLVKFLKNTSVLEKNTLRLLQGAFHRCTRQPKPQTCETKILPMDIGNAYFNAFSLLLLNYVVCILN